MTRAVTWDATYRNAHSTKANLIATPAPTTAAA